jgi:hypothetical protein
MFIPRYWSEASTLEKLPERRQITIRRFGWSSASEEDARVHARQRVEEALAALRAGGPEGLRDFTKQEHRVAYGGSEGLPIREEIVEERPPIDVVITRNSYGALCLNTPKAMFVDVDQRLPRTAGWGVLMFLVGAAAGAWLLKGIVGPVMLRLLIGGFAFALFVSLLARLFRALAPRRAVLVETLDQVREWCKERPDWLVAVYETPAGARLLTLHAEFDATSDTTREFMTHVRVDPLYRRMCELQKCFRARVSPKPWRAGVPEHFRAGGVWPVTDPARLARRRAWVARYDAIRERFASCRFVEEVGQGGRDRRVEEVRRLHDRLCLATSTLPLA